MERIDFETAKMNLPLSRGQIAERIANIPQDVILEYVSGLKKLKGNLEQYIAIMHAASGPNCETLIDEVPDENIGDLQIIAEILNTEHILARIDKLIAATWGTGKGEAADKERLERFCILVSKLEQLGADNVGSALWGSHREMNDFLRAFWFYAAKKDMDALKSYLAYFSNERLDSLIRMADASLKIFENSF